MDTPSPTAESARQPAASAIERLRQRDRIAGVYPIVLDRQWAKEHLEASEAAARAKRLGQSAQTELARLAELEDGRGEAVLEFKFRHCSPVRYETLLSQHRPTAEQRKEAEGQPAGLQPRWAPSFRAAFLHEVLVEPEMTHEEIVELFGDEANPESILSPGEAMELFGAAMLASNNVARFESPDL